jgi:guanylate kinase
LNEFPTSKPPGLLMVVSAPSGAGKTSICREFLKMYPDVRFSVSCTTREPRPGEVDGRDYVFISREEFQERIKRGEFVEWVENYGQFYGTAKKTLDRFLHSGSDLIMDIEPRGAKTIREHYPQGIFIFILPPSLPALMARLTNRGESGAVVESRLKRSQDEIREALWYNYIIVNEKLSQAVDQFRSIYIAEKCRRDRYKETIEAFLQ